MMVPDRVHPYDSDDQHDNSPPPDQPPRIPVVPPRPFPSQYSSSLSSSSPPRSTTTPAPGTYIIQVPKDLIYHTPPPENAIKYEQYTRRGKKSSTCSRGCVCFTLLIPLLLIAFASLTFYLIVRPKSPSFSIENFSVGGIDLNSSTSYPDFNVTVRADNSGNRKMGIYYERSGSAVGVYHQGLRLGEGSAVAFYQPPRNVTVVEMEVVGAGIVLSAAQKGDLEAEQAAGKVPLMVRVRVPVRFKVGAVKTWKVTVKVRCDMTLGGLTANAKVVSSACDVVSVIPW